jgi:hypothetical protein
MTPNLPPLSEACAISPDTVLRWTSSPFFRQEGEEKWLLLARGTVFICNGIGYEVLRRVDGVVTAESLLRQAQSVYPHLTFEQVQQFLLSFVGNNILQLDARPQDVSPEKLNGVEGDA